jgi:hypothetical protein
MGKDDSALITITSTTESAESLNEKVFGGEGEEGTEASLNKEPRTEEHRDGEQRNGQPARDNWDGIPTGLRKRIEKLTARAKSAEDRLQKYEAPGALESRTFEKVAERKAAESQNRGTEPRQANGAAQSGDASGTRSANDDGERSRRVQEVRTRHADFDETISSVAHVEIGDKAVAAARELPNAPEVAYVLGKMIKAEPGIADRMRANPEWAIAEIHKLSADVSRIASGGHQDPQANFESHPAWSDHKARVEAHVKANPLTEAEQRAAVNMPITAAIGHAIVELENSAEVTRYIVRHPEVHQRWRAMATEAAVLADIGRISARLEGGSNGNSRPRPVSNAPAPTTPEKGGSTRAHIRPEDEEDDDTFIRRRNEEERERRKRGYR